MAFDKVRAPPAPSRLSMKSIPQPNRPHAPDDSAGTPAAPLPPTLPRIAALDSLWPVARQDRNGKISPAELSVMTIVFGLDELNLDKVQPGPEPPAGLRGCSSGPRAQQHG